MSGVLEAARASVLALHGVGWTMIYSLAVGAVAGVGLLAVLHLLRRRAAWARYALCCGTLVIIAGVAPKAGLSIRSSYGGHGALAERIAAELMSRGAPETSGVLPGGWDSERLSRAVERGHDGNMVPWITGPRALALGTALAALGIVWAILALVSLGRLVVAWRRVDRLRRTGTRPASLRWSHVLERVRRRLDVRHPVEIAVTEAVDVPMVIGWLRPTIVLPPIPHDRLSEAQIEAILAHELAHVRRGDYAINLLQSVIEAVFFFNPIIRKLGDRIRAEREFCSDDLAFRSIDGSIRDYLGALEALETLRHGAAPEPAVAAGGGPLLTRMRRLAEMSKRRRRPRFDVDLAIVLAGLVLIWLPTLHLAGTARHASIAIMKHDLRLPRDFERIALEAGLHPSMTDRHQESGGHR